MTIYTWPSELIPNKLTFGLSANTGVFESPFNNAVMTHRFLGERWRATLEFNALDNHNQAARELDILQAFLWKLSGKNGRFTMGDFAKPGAPALGTPLVVGGSQYGGLLQTDGWTPDEIVLPMGSYFTINGELKFVISDIVSNSGGVATLEFAPWLRVSPADGDAIITENPTGMFRLASDDQIFNMKPGMNAEISIDVVEAFNV